MEKRHHPRVAVHNLTVDASDGIGFFHGEIADASRFGICLTDIPAKLDGAAEKMTVVVNGPGKNFKMIVIPRWYATTDRLNKSIGVEIMDPPWEWTEFIMDLEPEQEDDAWS